MLLKSFKIFQLHDDFEITPEELEKAISEFKVREPGSQEARTIGFSTVFNDKTKTLVQAQNNRILFRVSMKERLLPNEIVNKELELRVAEIEAKRGNPIGRKHKSEIKHDVITDLLPQSFIKTKSVHGYFDMNDRTLVIGSATGNMAESVAAMLRKALGSLPITNIVHNCKDPRFILANWLSEQNIPEDIEIMSKLKLQDPTDDKRKLKADNFALNSEEIICALNSGMLVNEAEIKFNDSITGVMKSDFSFTGISVTEVAREQMEDVDKKDELAILDAEFLIIASEVSKINQFIQKEFGSESL